MFFLLTWYTVFLAIMAQTWSHPHFEMLIDSMYSNIGPLTCKPCCETRRQGELIVHAKLIEEDCVSTTAITTVSNPTTTDQCTPCCETRRHGIVVIRAGVVRDEVDCDPSIFFPSTSMEFPDSGIDIGANDTVSVANNTKPEMF